MLLVRFMLFMMSRSEQKPAVEVILAAPDTAALPDAEPQQNQQPEEMPTDGKTVTREEMVRLFGGALRVR
ncbi:MAG: hypothetical protein WBG95_07490 [Sulfitobacter sp.]